MSLSQYVGLFSAESREHIATINRLLLELEADPSAPEPVEGLFRATHTIKGMSATLGFGSVADLAHEMESVLDEVRGARLQATQELVDALFEAVDALAAGVEDAVAERDPGAEVGALIHRLRRFARAGASAGVGATSAAPTPTAPSAGGSGVPSDAAAAAGGTDSRRFGVRVMVAANAPLPGVRAYLLVQKAKQLGTLDELVPSEPDIQAGTGFDGRVEFRLTTALDGEALRAQLRSVGDLAALEISEDTQVRQAEPRSPDPAPSVPAAPVRNGQHVDRLVRIDAERLDTLMDQVGELVVLRDRLHRVALARGGADLLEPVDLAARLIGELRDEVMRMRMVPISEVLDRFPRLVRDAARALGKRVDFVVEDSEIELDRSLLGRLGDPLVHLLRNAVDHGLEPPDERVRAGKPEVGQIRITVERERSRVVIRVSDDGRGIDREKVLRKAIEREIITAAEVPSLSDEDVFALAIRPGFSTAEVVTDVSGRGVGLDVVATEVRGLGGTLAVESKPGGGTTFVLRMPVTVGILRAVLVEVGGGIYAVPVAHVFETVEFRRDEVHTSAGGRVVFFREEPLPLISLRDLLEVSGEAPADELLQVVLVERADEVVGVEVDALVGQQEIVIKPFDATRDTLPYFSGATILSDGRPALILDASSVLQSGRAAGASLTTVPMLS